MDKSVVLENFLLLDQTESWGSRLFRFVVVVVAAVVLMMEIEEKLVQLLTVGVPVGAASVFG